MASEANPDVVVRRIGNRRNAPVQRDYGSGWGWRILVDTTDADNLRMRMDNVIPADQATAEMPAGPYPVMVMDVRRA